MTTYYRRTSNPDVMPVGYAMFATDSASVACYGDYGWIIDVDDAPHINDYRDSIIAAWETGQGQDSLDEYDKDQDGETVADLFNPENIVDSADGWDNLSLVEWLVGVVFGFNPPPVIRIGDGCIVFNTNLIQSI